MLITGKFKGLTYKDYETVNDLIRGLRKCFWFYNYLTTHENLGGRRPAEVYFQPYQLREAA